jgi:hypothetical protein
LIGKIGCEAIEICCYAALANALGDRTALGLQLARGVIAKQRGAERIGDGNLHCAGFFLQARANAGQRAAGADRRDETVDLAIRLLPDFLRRGGDVAVAVGDIVELVCPDCAAGFAPGDLLGEAAGHFYVIVRVLVGHGRHFDEFGAEQPQRVLLLLALRVGDDDDGAITQRLGDDRQADAGVAGGAFDDDAAGPEQAAPLRVADDEQAGAVLHRLAGIHEFGLAENLAAGFLGSAAQPDQRRVADRIDDRTHHHSLPVKTGGACCRGRRNCNRCSDRDRPRHRPTSCQRRAAHSTRPFRMKMLGPSEFSR